MSNRRRLRPGPYRLRESATAVAPGATVTIGEAPGAPVASTGGERAELRETVTAALTEAPTSAGGPTVVDLILIEAGWNQAGTRYYPADVLARDIPTVFPAGTHQHWDHPSLSEAVERPERSLSTLTAVLTETPYLAMVEGKQVMRAKARVFSPYAPLLAEMWPHIGVSINADGAGEYGEREGRRGLIVESIDFGKSVDFVTKPGAGGRILSLLESARQTGLREARSFGAWLESRLHLALTQFADDAYGDGRLTRDERIALSNAIGKGLEAWTAVVLERAPQLFKRDLYDEPPQPVTAIVEAATEDVRRALSTVLWATYGGDDRHVWVRDYDAERSVVWYEVTGDDACTTWQEGYQVVGGVASLTGGRVEVVPRMVYTPVRPADPADAGGAETQVVEADRSPTASQAPAVEPGSGPGSPPDTKQTPEEEGVMPELTPEQLREAAEARTKAETERDLALREAAEAKAQRAESDRALARYRALDTARPIATTLLAESDLPPAAQQRVLAGVTGERVPLTEALALDEAAFRTRIGAEIAAEGAYLAQLRESAGEGQVRGAGSTAVTGTAAATPSVDERTRTRAALVESYRARGLSEDAANKAANGRPF
ncbi:hypothetical protein [Phytohabitans houttuyneae]|uniref:Uncharacterized protein n=1 Tax=Phytohabitans houttuyneae TaxID=1076126 RepID=A0A6V8K7J2_9ACTN|nr:hypothetical protein [Phytohabitans houttuyneae]GFJ79490.1 hypothetical protein Phou_036700 [Phytohabitans houttuyneae]